AWRMARRIPLGVLLAAAAVLPPLLWLGGEAGEAVLRYGPGLLDRVALRLLGRSLLLAGATALLTAATGGSYGWLVCRYSLPPPRAGAPGRPWRACCRRARCSSFSWRLETSASPTPSACRPTRWRSSIASSSTGTRA